VNIIFYKECNPLDLECDSLGAFDLDLFGTSMIILTAEIFIFFLLLVAMELRSDEGKLHGRVLVVILFFWLCIGKRFICMSFFHLPTFCRNRPI
jgi:hypothetical protein